MNSEIKEIQKRFEHECASLDNEEKLGALRIRYLGRKGILTNWVRQISDLPTSERAARGRLLNALKSQIHRSLQQKQEQLQGSHQSSRGPFDSTLPGAVPTVGGLHPLTLIQIEVEEVFRSLGFQIFDGPEVESEYYNFESLNIPATHPARDLQDTFFVKGPKTTDSKKRLLLRTQTSNMQVRVMEKQQPPLRAIVIGRVYRYEQVDASHDHTFTQLEGFVVDRNVSVANLRYVLQGILTALLGRKVDTRLRQGYFPFVEPGFELDLKCLVCKGRGCSVCKHVGWIEVLGCGMIHPRVFEFAGYPKGMYTGFAFGLGLDRLVMMRYGIEDIRYFRNPDLRFLKQFR